MARNFVRASSQRVFRDTTGTFTTSLSFAMRVRLASLPSADNTFYNVFSLANGTSGTDRRNIWLDYRQTSGTRKWDFGFTNFGSGGTYNELTYSVDATAGQWYNLSGHIDWSTNPDTWLLNIDGSAVINTTSGNTTPDSGNYRLTIGANHSNNTIGSWFDGDIAEFGLWSATLTTGEHAALAAGAAPSLVRPASLICYVPFLGGINDRIGGALTDVNSTNAEHPPRVFYPRAPKISAPLPPPPPSSLLPKLIQYGAYL